MCIRDRDKKEQQVEECVKSLLGLGWDVGRIAKALIESDVEADSMTDDKTDETATCTTDDDMPALEPVVESLLRLRGGGLSDEGDFSASDITDDYERPRTIMQEPDTPRFHQEEALVQANARTVCSRIFELTFKAVSYTHLRAHRPY